MIRYPKPSKRAKAPAKPICRRRTLAAVRAERKAAGPGVEHDTWMAILLWYRFCCAYCAGAPAFRLEQDHVKPLAKGGKHVPENVVPACPRCNLTKGTLRRKPYAMHPYRARAVA